MMSNITWTDHMMDSPGMMASRKLPATPASRTTKISRRLRWACRRRRATPDRARRARHWARSPGGWHTRPEPLPEAGRRE